MIADIWRSFRALPLWVQVWVALWLVPMNLLGFAFLPHPLAWLAGGLGALVQAAEDRGLEVAREAPDLRSDGGHFKGNRLGHEDQDDLGVEDGKVRGPR